MKLKIMAVLLLLNISLLIFAQDSNPAKELFYAIKDGELITVKEIIESGLSVDYQYENKIMAAPLHLSVIADRPEITRYLLEQNADMYLHTTEFFSPFDMAVLSKKYEIADIFLEAGYNIDAASGKMSESEMAEFSTLLAFSIMNNIPDAIDFLKENGADPDLPADFLFRSVRDSQTWIVERYLNAGFNINYSIKKYNNSSAIFIANENNNIEMVKFLLSKGADLYQTNASDMSIFDVAVSLHNFELAELYLEQYSYDIGSLDGFHRTTLFHCTINEDLQAVKFLFEHGSNPNSYQYDTAHYLNVYFGAQGRDNKDINIDIVKMYIDYGLNLAEQDAYGYTFFHNAAMTDDVKLLDGLAVSPEALNLKTNQDGNTALIFAVFSRSFSIAEKLIELGADPNVKNSEGVTAAFYLVKMEELEMLDYLIKNGADVNIEDNEGNTIFDICPDSIKEQVSKYR